MSKRSLLSSLLLPLNALPFYFISLFLIFFQLSSFAENNSVDSLQTILSNTTDDAERLIILKELTNELSNIDYEQAKIYAQKVLDLSRKMGDQVNEVKALNKMGLMLYESSNRASSLAYFEKSERLANKLELRELQARNLMSIAKYHRYTTRDSAKTVESFLKSAEISKMIDFHWGTGRSYAKLASFYTRYNKIELCEDYLKLSAKYYMLNPDGHKTVAHYYTEVGDKIWEKNPKKSMDLYFKGKEYKLTPNLMVSLAKAHKFIGENEIALNYIEEAIEYYHKTDDKKRMLGIALFQLAEIRFQLGDYLLADKTCDTGIALLAKLSRSDQKALPDLYRTKAITLEKQGKNKEALAYFTKSIQKAEKNEDINAQASTILALGMFYTSKDIKKAKKYCENSLEIAKSKKITNIEIISYDCLYNIYKAEGDYKSALNYIEQKILLQDSTNSMNVSNALAITNKMAEKDKLIAKQSFQKEIKDKELKNQYIINLSLVFGLILGLLLIGIMAKSNRRISKQNKEINEKTDELLQANLSLGRSNKELERFAHIASHDLKTPLRSIVSFTALLRRKLEKEDYSTVGELLDYIENGGKRMNQLIEDVLEFSRLGNNDTLAKGSIDLNLLLDEIAHLVRSSSTSKEVKFEISALPNLNGIHSRIYLLFKNLIENGVKYNESNIPSIKVYYKYISEVHAIYIEDNGIGIKEEFFKEIFVMFNRLHNQSKYEGTGLGLATCQKIVEDFEGTITVTSKVNEGSIFKIEIPNKLILKSTSKVEVEEKNYLQEV